MEPEISENSCLKLNNFNNTCYSLVCQYTEYVCMCSTLYILIQFPKDFKGAGKCTPPHSYHQMQPCSTSNLSMNARHSYCGLLTFCILTSTTQNCNQLTHALYNVEMQQLTRMGPPQASRGFPAQSFPTRDQKRNKHIRAHLLPGTYHAGYTAHCTQTSLCCEVN